MSLHLSDLSDARLRPDNGLYACSLTDVPEVARARTLEAHREDEDAALYVAVEGCTAHVCEVFS